MRKSQSETKQKIAVLLPHYNNFYGLKLTLESLLNETEPFTLFLFDDGSDNYSELVALVTNFQNRIDIRLERNELNLGIVKTLNRGLNEILKFKEYSFIARIDAGDRCLNNRFEKQKQLLVKNKNIGLVGSWVQFVDTNRKNLFIFKAPESHDKLRNVIHLYNPFIHPSVMFRSNVVEIIGFYPKDYKTLQDHAYFFKVIKEFRTAVIQKVLLEYEVNPESISTKQRKSQAANRIRLLIQEFKFGFYPLVGLLRAIITYLTPQNLLIKLKQYVFYR